MTDNQQITTREGKDLAAAPRREIGIPIEQRVSLLREAMTNPDVQPEKATALAELMFRMEDRDREAAFIEAKTQAIAQMPRVGKDGYNTHLKSHYAKWETMQPIVTRVLARFGLALSFEIGDANGKVSARPILQGHGWTERGDTMVLPADASGSGTGRNPLQAIGSAQSYAKRYAAMAMLNILQGGAPSDDDGHTGGGNASDPYDALTPEERELVDEARSKAGDGTAEYEAWYKALEPGKRGFLAYNRAGNGLTWHDQNKDLASKV